MSDANTEQAPRARRGHAPWVLKRRRIIKIVVVLLVLCLPILIWRILLARETNALLNDVASSGSPLTLAQLNAQYSMPAEGENAALTYTEALRLYVDIPRERLGELPLTGRKDRGMIEDDLWQAAATWLSANEAALKKVKEARTQAVCQFLAPYAPGGYNDYAVVQRMPDLCALACSAAMLHAYQNDADAARSALLDAVALARSVEKEGVYPCLLYQWSMESMVLEAFEFTADTIKLDDQTLQDFSSHFAPERRLAQIRRMTTVETCLFVSRVREGRRRNLMRALFVAAGGGDMNIRAYLGLMADIVAWTEASLAEQSKIEDRFSQRMSEVQRRPLLFLTLHVSVPPGNWDFYRKRLDEAALAQTAFALVRFHAVRGQYPERLGALVPEFLEVTPVLPSTGAPIPYQHTGETSELHDGVEGPERQRISLGDP